MARFGLESSDDEQQRGGRRWGRMLWWFVCGLVVNVLWQKRSREQEREERFVELWATNVIGHFEARDTLLSAMRSMKGENLRVAIQGPSGVGKTLIADVLRESLPGSSVWDDVADLPDTIAPRVIATGRNFESVPPDWIDLRLFNLRESDLRNLVAAHAFKNVSRAVAETLFKDHERAWRGRVDFDERLSDFLVRLMRESKDHAHELARFRVDLDVDDAAAVLLRSFGQDRCRTTVDDPICFVSLVAASSKDDRATTTFRIVDR